MAIKAHSIFDREIHIAGIVRGCEENEPDHMVKNPVMFVTEAGAFIVTAGLFFMTGG